MSTATRSPRLASFFLALLPFFAACGDTTAPEAESAAPDVARAMHPAASSDEAPVLTFADPGGPAVGVSTLVRTGRGFGAHISTGGLEPGTAATVWAVIFNTPDGCSDACGEDDLTNPDATPDVVYLAGGLVGPDGSATFAGSRRVGDAGGSIAPIALGSDAIGLLDARGAEVHFVVRDHGPAVPGLISAQIGTFGGGCAGFPPELGTPGDYPCEDLQFAVHMP